MAGLNERGFGSWNRVERETLTERIERQVVSGDALTMAKLYLKKGAFVGTHSHPNEQFTYILEGRLRFRYGEHLEHEVEVGPGEILHLPANVPHNALCLEDAIDLDVFTPVRADWLAPDGNRYFAGTPAAASPAPSASR
ncbi:cupin domain protein [Burkholderia thailandensis USAMRU Malaysia |uniref:Pectin degradation protein kdgF n=1 Tax=Burkholderia thailandensis (strain ATCC 700388 / DSM 13276 / CCUG 48851 / CIP 106301 / E264) TaxID=271848 RepID=Q2T7S8_BURTA|nr:pectin degradation protein kdgF [Burkholderia thailandensis E264]AHI75472.1 cupin domain protein [Burkholderia thailandensis 2002721723]AHI82129.1 cupin domain protein [Burkholderia thailandensis E444]AIC90299.1 cupin domain protein [Burkholderia thailandensis USAMRU Malaysia \